KEFSSAEFHQILQASNFVAVSAFWRGLERFADSESQVRLHAMGVLTELAQSCFRACEGWAYSPQQAECFLYLGLTRGVCGVQGQLGRGNMGYELAAGSA